MCNVSHVQHHFSLLLLNTTGRLCCWLNICPLFLHLWMCCLICIILLCGDATCGASISFRINRVSSDLHQVLGGSDHLTSHAAFQTETPRPPVGPRNPEPHRLVNETENPRCHQIPNPEGSPLGSNGEAETCSPLHELQWRGPGGIPFPLS